MNRRSLLRSALALPFLPFFGREKAEAAPDLLPGIDPTDNTGNSANVITITEPGTYLLGEAHGTNSKWAWLPDWTREEVDLND